MRKLIRNARARKNKCTQCSHAHKCSTRPFDTCHSYSFIYVNGIYCFLFFQKLLYWKMKNNNSDAKQIESSQQAMSHCNQEFYPNISTILQLLLTLPVASCLYERSFSSLRRLKTWSRTSMADGMLNQWKWKLTWQQFCFKDRLPFRKE